MPILVQFHESFSVTCSYPEFSKHFRVLGWSRLASILAGMCLKHAHGFKRKANTPEWSLIKCQKKVYFNILIVTIRQKGWWSWPVTRKERLIRPTWSIVNYGFAMHYGAIEKLPFCYRPNRPIFVKIQVRKKVNTKLVHTVWLTLLAGCR